MAPPLDDSRPAYVQVADELRGDIQRGRFNLGERLPSVRDLSVRFEISPVTTRHALTVLRDEGWIFAQSTRGYFVRETPTEDPPAGQSPSQEYLAIRTLLGAVQDTVDSLSQRVGELEALVAPSVDPGPDPTAKRPARKARRA